MTDARLQVGTVLTAVDPQPPAGAVVLDGCGMKWISTGDYPAAWIPADGDGDPETWTKIAGNYGPVTIVSEAFA